MLIEAGDPAADRAAVADATAAPRTAVCRRRSRDRADLPARHLPAGAAGAVCALGARAGASAAQLPAARQLDRRRSRRQSERHGRVAAARAAAAPRRRCSTAISISCTRSAPSCRISTELATATTRCSQLAERSGDANPGARRRALSPRDHRHLCAARRDLREAHRPSAGARALPSRGEPYQTPRQLRADLVDYRACRCAKAVQACSRQAARSAG